MKKNISVKFWPIITSLIIIALVLLLSNLCFSLYFNDYKYILFTIPNLLCILFIFSLKYTINWENLEIWYFSPQKIIPVKQITKITTDKSIKSALQSFYSFSFNHRIKLHFWENQSIVITPSDKKTFFEYLNDINKNIDFDI